MSFSVGIVGLPNVGKSTLFKALTKKPVDIAPYPFTTIHPNVGVIIVPDERINKIAEIIKPEKITPTVIEFVDIAGLVKNAHKGEGLGNQFLAQIRNCDAILEIIRGFNGFNIENVLGEINPEKEIEVVNTELLMKDMETLEIIISKTEKEAKSGEKNAMKKLTIVKKIKDSVSQGKLIKDISLDEEERTQIKEYQFLTEKPIVYLLNTKSPVLNSQNFLNINLLEEEEASDLSKEEKKEIGFQSKLDQIILSCYNALSLITFFTITGGKEVRAWTLKSGLRAPDAGGIVHSDFKEKFIKAEVINWDKLIESGSWTKAKEKGQIQTVGKDYFVQDGNIIEFKI